MSDELLTGKDSIEASQGYEKMPPLTPVSVEPDGPAMTSLDSPYYQ